MENEDNRGLNDKKDSKDQWASLISSVLDLSHYSLSLTRSWTLRVFLEHFSIGARKVNKVRGSKDQVGTGRIKQL